MVTNRFSDDCCEHGRRQNNFRFVGRSANSMMGWRIRLLMHRDEYFIRDNSPLIRNNWDGCVSPDSTKRFYALQPVRRYNPVSVAQTSFITIFVDLLYKRRYYTCTTNRSRRAWAYRSKQTLDCHVAILDKVSRNKRMHIAMWQRDHTVYIGRSRRYLPTLWRDAFYSWHVNHFEPVDCP